MEKQMKLFTFLTKPLVLFVLLFALGVGQMWGDMYLAGTMNSWAQTDATKFVDNKIEVTLAAETTYTFKIVDGDKWRSFDGSFSNTSLNYVLDKENVDGYNISITTGEAGTYIFQYSWYDSKHHLSVYYPQARLKKNTVLYFDGRNSTKGWGTYTWGARFFYKYYDSGGDHSSLDCTSAVEDYVHYTTVPNHDYLGQIQVERKDPSNMDGDRWNYTGVCCAYNRANSGQNCMAISNDNKDWDNTFIPVWTTYCPPISSVTMTDNGSTLYGGNGSAGTPYLIEAGDPIRVHVTEAVSAVDDGNMIANYQFKDGASNIGDEGTVTSASKTSGSSGTTHTIIVEARNKYNGAAGTLARCTLYYETKTVYTGLSVAKSGDDSKASAPTISQTWAIATNSVTVTATVPDGYYFTGWTSSNGSFGDATALSTTFTPTADNAVATATYALRWAISTSYDEWSTNDHIIGNISTSAGVTSGYVDITLPANTDYELKVFDKTNHWLGHTTSGVKLTYSNSGTKYAMAEGNYNLGFTTAGAGSYRFTWDITNSKVSVTYPESFQVTAAGNPAAGGTVTPSSATYMSTSVGGEITATPNYSHYFNGWTSSAGGTFTSASSATTTFKPASAAATVTAAFPERTAFIEGNFQIYNSTRATRTKTGDSWQDASTAIKMTYDAGNNRYYLHTYSTPTELREQLNDAGAFFYVKTSTSSSSIADAATYKAYSSAAQSLSEYGSSHSLLVITGESEHGFKFTGSEDGYVIIYFNGTHVWYELECALSYYGGEGATGDAPAARTYYAYGSNQTAAANTYSKTGYSFDHWDTAADDSGSDYAAGATNVAMNAREVCLHAQWTAKEYTINLANMEATTAGTPSVTVTFDASTNMTASDVITKPTKTHYDFGGYWTSENTGATLDHQLIGADGKWIKDVEGYTSHDGSGNPTWVHDYPISLFAKWTETPYTITPSVSPAGAGSVNTVTDAHLITPSSAITATPTNAAWIFDHWVCGDEVGFADGSGNTDRSIQVTAGKNSTITAYFKPRYELVGCIWNDSGNGGMPGWSYDGTGEFTVNSFTALGTGEGTGVDLSYSCTLLANTTYKFEVHDRVKGNHGKYYAEGQYLNDGDHALLNQMNNDVPLAAIGAGTYTFRITNMTYDGTTDDYFPTITVERPYQVNLGWQYKTLDADATSGNTGGTAAMSKTSGGDAVSNGSWVPYGTGVTYTASPTTGYSVAWYSSSEYSGDPFTTDAVFYHTATSTGNGYAKFTEKTTTVSLENDGHGKVQIGGVDKISTTCGVTTTRTLTAVPKTGYAFRDWSKPSGDDITLSSTTTNPTTLTGLGAGLSEGQRVYASFDEVGRTITASAGTGGTVGAASYTAYIDTKTDITATPATGYKFKEWQETGGTSNVTFDNVHSASTKIKATGDATIQAVFEPRWSVAGSWLTYPESAAWDADTYKMGNIGTNGSSKDTCYVEITLPANTDLTFKIVDRGEDGTVGVGSYVDYGNNTTATQYIKYNNHTNWGFGLKSSGYYDCGITTTGGGTYKFAFNITDKSLTVTYQTSYQSNFGWKYADGAGSLHDGDNGGTITVTANDGGSHTISNGQWVAAGASITYTASPATGYDFAGWHNNSDCSTGKFNDNLSWTDGPLAATSNSYAKFVPVAVTFTNNSGSGDGKWSTASNWSPACVPTIDHDVVITEPVTVDITNARAKSVVLDQHSGNTGHLSIDAGKELVIAGNLRKTTDGSSYGPTAEEDLYIDSNPTLGLGALVMGSHDGTNQATINFYSKSHGTKNSRASVAQYLGVPFTDATVLSDLYNSWVYKINNDDEGNIYWKRASGNETLYPFKGYCVYAADNEVPFGGHYYWMQGTMVATANQNLTLYWNGGTESNPNNETLLANSWMAPIKISAFETTDFSGADATIYIFNAGSLEDWVNAGGKEEGHYDPKPASGDAEPAPGQYSAYTIKSTKYTGDAVIPAMQSFSVFTNGTVASYDGSRLALDFNRLVYTPAISNNADPVPNRAPSRNEETNPEQMRIYVSAASGYSDKLLMLGRADFEQGFENGWDGHKIFGETFAPQLYAMTPDGNMSINCIPTFEGTVLGFKPGDQDNNYTFYFRYDGNKTLYLNDLKEQKSTLIRGENTYMFTTATGDLEARFVISATPIANVPTGCENIGAEADQVRKLIIRDHIYIIRAGRIYDATGAIVK